MNQDEVNNLLSVMQKRISDLTSQNIMLEAKIIYLNNVIAKMNTESSSPDGGGFEESSSSTQKKV